MRRFWLGIAGIVLTTAVAGCSDTGVQEGTVPFKGTNTESLNVMKNQMTQDIKAQEYAKKSSAGSKEGESKAATETKEGASKPQPEQKKEN